MLNVLIRVHTHTHIFHFSRVRCTFLAPLSSVPFILSSSPTDTYINSPGRRVLFIFLRRFFFFFSFSTILFSSSSNIYFSCSFFHSNRKVFPLQSREKIDQGRLKTLLQRTNRGTLRYWLPYPFHNATLSTKVHRICIRLHLGSVSISKLVIQTGV